MKKKVREADRQTETGIDKKKGREAGRQIERQTDKKRETVRR